LSAHPGWYPLGVNARRAPRIPPVPLVLLVLLASTVAIVGTAAASPADMAAPQPPAPSTAGIVVVLVSANAEWAVVKALHPDAACSRSPWGEYFQTTVQLPARKQAVIFLHGGWGKVAAAGSAQYAIDRWHPALLVNLGTCGGFDSRIARFEVVLADRTVIYDIKEAMGDSAEAIAEYATTIDLSWLRGGYPSPVRKTVLVSADRDLVPAEIAGLEAKYGAVAADWESGAIAHTCARNRQRVLILRGVSDLVNGATGGEAYGNPAVFQEGTRVVMTSLVRQLPKWLARLW
jgi:adenosylhomocysteine nucleosidase